MVHTPDLFEGRTFETTEEGVAYAGEIGFGEVIGRGARAVEALPANVVYGGFSLGVLPAQALAHTRAGARGALLVSACVPIEEFGEWPEDVPVQIHAMQEDPISSVTVTSTLHGRWWRRSPMPSCCGIPALGRF